MQKTLNLLPLSSQTSAFNINSFSSLYFIIFSNDDASLQVSPIACKRKSPLLPRPPLRSRSSHHRRGNIPCGSVVRFWPRSPPSSKCGSQSRSTTNPDQELCTANVSKRPKTHDHSIPCIILLSSSSLLLCNYYHLNILSPSLLFYFNVSGYHCDMCCTAKRLLPCIIIIFIKLVRPCE